MATSFVGSSLRRSCAPAGALALLCLLLAAPAPAATPTPDPPPLAVGPEAPPAASTPAPAASAPVAPAAPVVRRSAPAVVRTAPAPQPASRPKSRPAAAKRPPAATPRIARAPHDRGPVPLVALAAAEAAFDRSLLALAGVLLGLVTLGGGLVFQVARRSLEESAA